MPKRSTSSEDLRPRKRTSNTNPPSTIDIRAGQILTDISGKQWKLGRTVGIGGFGAIFLATDDVMNDADDSCKYVAKVETHSSGPLFVEINCYIRIAKEEYIEEYMMERNLKKLGIAHYVASGSYIVKGSKLRFLILPRYDHNLEQMFNINNSFNYKTVLIVALQLLDVIEYIHENGYVHCDIKASNIMIKRNVSSLKGYKMRKAGGISLRKKKVNRAHFLRSDDVENTEFGKEYPYDFENNNQVYLLDFGLVSKYRQPDGQHKDFCCDQRKAHAGTLLFCSLDAHNGIQVRRSDLESLGYNVVYWLTSTLPWMNDIEDPVLVHKMKQKCLANLHNFLERCFTISYPKFIYDYFKYLVELDYDAEPDYDYCRNLFKRALDSYGYNNQYITKYYVHLKKRRDLGIKYQISYKLNRIPLSSKPSNLPLKPKRRAKNKKVVNLSWSKVLTDPELILRRAKNRDRKLTETSDTSASVQNMDINDLNPTYAMVDVYNKCMERLQSGLSPRSYDDPENIDGYTPAMMAVHTRVLQREQFEEEQSKMVTRTRKYTKRQKRSLKNELNCTSIAHATRSRKGKKARSK